MKILVFTYHNENCHEGPSFKIIGELTKNSKEEYCKVHGYDFYLKDKDFDYSKRINYERIDIFLEKINEYDWIWYLDADCMIMNHTIKLENLIDNNYDIIMASNPNNKKFIEINNGSVLIKKSDWSINFLNHINSLEQYYSHPWVSQQAIIDYINITNIEEAQKHIKIVHPRYFNSFYHQWYPQENFKIGDFVIHPAGSSNDYRIKLLTEIKKYIIKMPNINIETQPFV